MHVSGARHWTVFLERARSIEPLLTLHSNATYRVATFFLIPRTMRNAREIVMNKTGTVPVFKEVIVEWIELCSLCLLLSGQRPAGSACLTLVNY